ncbi:hypothetical protein CDD81_6789 [Ophiocordyceps australis]|uniref:Uncharacterized protein n=1 Tax=Ophiocordyceps australis TaxID=1399860 RepID=A0A2C5Y5L3_9HYPO|nr:hypothetical protein CDD81_6789 [Ophiocordyceps australis]
MKSTTLLLFASSVLALPSKRSLGQDDLASLLNDATTASGVELTWATETFFKDCMVQDSAVRDAYNDPKLEDWDDTTKNNAKDVLKTATTACFSSRKPDTDEGLCFGLDDGCAQRVAGCKEKNANKFTNPSFDKFLRGTVLRRCLRDEKDAPPTTTAPPKTTAPPTTTTPPTTTAPPVTGDESVETLCNGTKDAAACMAGARRCSGRFSRTAKPSSVFECAKCIMESGPENCENFGEGAGRAGN